MRKVQSECKNKSIACKNPLRFGLIGSQSLKYFPIV